MWPRQYGRRKGARRAVRPDRAIAIAEFWSRPSGGESGSEGKSVVEGDMRRGWQGFRGILAIATLPGFCIKARRIVTAFRRGKHCCEHRRLGFAAVLREAGRGGQAIGCWDWSAATVARRTLPAHRPGRLPGAFALACWKPRLEEGFALRCLQRLSFPDLATRRCP